MARTRTRTFRVVPGDTKQWDRFLVDFLAGLEGVEATELADINGNSVLGRGPNTSGQPAAITAGADGQVLRVSGTNLAFGTVATAGIAADAVTDAKLRDSAALSVIGRSANTVGDPADIVASSDDEVLRRSGASIGFGQIVAGGIATDAVTNAKLANMAQATVKGRAAGAGTGDPTDLSAAQVATIVNASLDHGTLTGLSDDDHPQYPQAAATETIGGAWTYTDRLTLGGSTQNLIKLLFNGQEYFQAANTSTDGIAMILGVNRTNNRQLWILDSAATASNTTNAMLRIVHLSTAVTVDVLATDVSTQLPLTIGTNLLVGGNLTLTTIGNKFLVKEGSNASMGVATLVGGTVTVSNTLVAAGDRIFLSRATLGGTAGHLSYTISAATSFTINSSSGTDTSTVNWLIVSPAP